jgi:hypothetical protein
MVDQEEEGGIMMHFFNGEEEESEQDSPLLCPRETKPGVGLVKLELALRKASLNFLSIVSRCWSLLVLIDLRIPLRP